MRLKECGVTTGNLAVFSPTLPSVLFLSSTNQCSTLMAQIKACREFKTKFKATLLAKPLPTTTAADLFVLLVASYTPWYNQICTSLEWVTESFIELLLSTNNNGTSSETNTDITPVLRLIISAGAFALQDISSGFGNADVISSKQYVSCMLQLAHMDKESHWLDYTEVTDSIGDTYLVQYMHVLNTMLSNYIEILFGNELSQGTTAVLTETAVAYCEYCADLCKALSTVLRTRRQLTVLPQIRSPAFISNTELFLTSVFIILRSDYINRVR